MIPEEVIDQIRNETNIADIVSQFVSLKKSGSNLFGICPFHSENTASFSVNEPKQIFHCFSCGRGGNVFKFMMEMENISYPEAVMRVADMQGIEIPDKYKHSKKLKTDVNPLEQKLINMHEQATELYSHILMNTEVGQPALDYLHERGLTDETIKFYRLGFAPKDQILNKFLENKHVQYDDMRKSGLFIETDDGKLRDRFFDRIMFPIKNEFGNLIGFSGRVMGKNASTAKYLNSPETDIFNKRKVLFNLSDAKTTIQKQKNVILFEGFMDVISAYQSGVTNGIASMGTSLTTEQITTIKRLTPSVSVCYDGDAPGQNAINRALSLLSNTDLSLGVIQMPEGIDPDEYRKQYGEKKFAGYMHSAYESPLSFKMRYFKLNRNLDNETDQISYINDVLKEIAKISDPLERDIYVNQLSDQFNLNKLDLTNRMNIYIQKNNVNKSIQKSKNELQQGHSTIQQIDNVRSHSKVELAELYLFNRILMSREMWQHLMSKDGFAFVDDDFQLLYTLAQGYMSTHDKYKSAEFQDFIKKEKLQNMLINIEMLPLSDAPNKEEVDDYVNIIMNEAPIDVQLKNKQAELNDAKKLGDIDKQTELAMEIIKLQRQKQLNDRT